MCIVSQTDHRRVDSDTDHRILPVFAHASTHCNRLSAVSLQNSSCSIASAASVWWWCLLNPSRRGAVSYRSHSWNVNGFINQWVGGWLSYSFADSNLLRQLLELNLFARNDNADANKKFWLIIWQLSCHTHSTCNSHTFRIHSTAPILFARLVARRKPAT